MKFNDEMMEGTHHQVKKPILLIVKERELRFRPRCPVKCSLIKNA